MMHERPDPEGATSATALPSTHARIRARVAVLPLVVLAGALAVTVGVWELPGHLALVVATAFAALLARLHGHPWARLEAGMVESLTTALPAILILLVIGMLMATWMIGGIVPGLVIVGLKVLRPEVFLPASAVVCAIVSLVSGSSWSTAGTVGLALMGVGQAMGFDAAPCAGAIVSGAYFGDKLSPMSDTTNLAPAVAGTDLFTHVRHMARTTIPAFGIALVLFTLLGLQVPTAVTAGSVANMGEILETHFPLQLGIMLVPVVVLGLVLARIPALPSLCTGVLLGGMAAIFGQGVAPEVVLRATMAGYKATTGHPQVDELLSRGGMESMSSTVLLIVCAMCFGGVMERSGMLRVLAGRVLVLARTRGRLVATTVGTAFGMNIVASDQYMSIVVPGRMYAQAYRDLGLHPKHLSRALEDGGTITSVFVPWNTCGAFMAKTLGVATSAYAPYALFNLVNPLLAIGLALLRSPGVQDDEATNRPNRRA